MITYKEFAQKLDEARKNPELNPKISAYDALLPYKDDDNAFIHFTNLQKLGVNPMSDYGTPLGIYSYPLKQVWKLYDLDKVKSLKALPFGSDRTYIQLFKWNGKGKFIDDLSKDYTSADYDLDMAKIKSIYEKKIDKSKTQSLWKKITKAVEKYELETDSKFEEGKPINFADILNDTFSDWKTSEQYKSIIKDLYLLGKEYLKDKSDTNWNKLEKRFELYKLQTPRRLNINMMSSVSELEDDIKQTIAGSMMYSESTFDSKKVSILKELKPLQDEYNNSLIDIDLVINAATKSAIDPSPASCFWNVTRWMSNYGVNPHVNRFLNTITMIQFDKSKVKFPRVETKNIFVGSRQWGELLRKLGYAGFADRKAKGIIHPSEPCQAVFMSMEFIEPISTILNKDYVGKIKPSNSFLSF